ncbi:hypothetical protein E0Z10_g4180 [Xylaria hypoxylon]|uniref:Ubiquitin-like domain-containing protein n=1 Tax=Xylaria hypoxylon TaxID=37992 RepID=A0A4Z0YYM9_9PEZI|nr:hypothetical protein E0Z10_g4180 [Xylaria hypoxylon]
MAGSSYDPSLSSQFVPETERIDLHRQVRPPIQPGFQPPWYPPTYYPQYPGVAPYPANNIAPYPQLATQNAPARWGGFNPFDEEEQERRKKGKELIPLRPIMNGYPPSATGHLGGYGLGAYGPLQNTMWPALPPSQPAPLPLIPFPGEPKYSSRRPGKHVHHLDQMLGAGQRHDPRSPGLGDKIIRDVDGILTPSSGDLTVHLTMDLEEDLEDRLDEMNRLSRLGHFSSANRFFQEHLHHHIDNPYVLVQYADLLLHQGDLKGVTLLKDDAMYKREGEQPDSRELRTLRVNWELLQILAKSRTLDALSGAPDVFGEAVNLFTVMAKEISPDRSISSTEIEILALTLQLTSRPALNSKWLRYGSRALTAFSITLLHLYQTLLRQGRIWDFHDLVVLMPTIEDIKALTYDVFGKDLIPSLGILITDWSDSVHGYDASTTLGLLSIMTHIMLEPVEASEKECIDILKLCLPLAISIAENDPSSLKSRPYLRLLLAKSRFAETASRQAIDTLTTRLQSAQGVFYHSDIALLPIYVPSENETPQWGITDQPPELKTPVRLVLRSAIELGDLETEVLARQELLRLSSNPREEFDTLCALQLSRQGDLNGYGLSLASKYLVSNTKEAKEELAILISRLLSKVASTDYWDPSQEWILNMLLYKLEGRSPSAIKHMLERSNTDYQNMEEPFLREISRKMPILKDWVDQQAGNSTNNKVKDTVLRAGSRSRRNNKPAARRTRGYSLRRTPEQPSKRAQQVTVNEQKDERDTPWMAPKPEDSREDNRPQPEDRPSHTHLENNGEQVTTDQRRDNQETPLIEVSRPKDDPHNPFIPPHRPEPMTIDLPVNERRQDDAVLAAQIRKKLEAEFDQRLEAEKNSERERRNERMEILEGLKKAADHFSAEVEAIRREAVEQAEKKSRVEAQERTEQLRWERRIEESKLEKEIAMANAEAAGAELDAKFEAEREAAIKDVEKKMKEEFEMRKMKENEARVQAEHEIRKRTEAKKRAHEEAKTAENLREELQRRVAVEVQEKKKAMEREWKKAEENALEAAKKQAEEEANKNTIRQWAAEKAEKDLETQNRIHFKDAVGRKFTIPFSQARTWEGMRELIESAFRHVEIIGPEVQEGHYDLIEPDGTIILPQTWEELIQPGWNITMHMWPIGPPPQLQPLGMPPPIPELNIPASGPFPPAPPVQSVNAETVVIEPDEQVRVSVEQTGDDVSSGYEYGSDISSWKPSRARRIANVFSALKTNIFRRRRHASSSTASSRSIRSEEIID